MSARALAALAALLFLLCVTAGGLLAHRLGWLDAPKPLEWTFVNPTLAVARGQRVVLRPIVEGIRPVRYTFVREFTEPEPDDPVAPVPHLRAGVEELEDGQWGYNRLPVEALAFCQLGALTAQEWLIRIEPVIERRGPGQERLLLKANYGRRNGAFVSYYFDPEKPVPAVGWTRSELNMENRPPEVYFASDGGRALIPDGKDDIPDAKDDKAGK